MSTCYFAPLITAEPVLRLSSRPCRRDEQMVRRRVESTIGFILKTFNGSWGFIPATLTVVGIDWLWATSDRWRRRPQAAEVHRGWTWSARTGLGCRAGSGGRCARPLRGCSCSCSIHSMIADPKHALAHFLPSWTFAHTLDTSNVDTMRTRDVVAMD